MANERALLARARDYMRDLSEGRDPLTGQEADEDTLASPRLRRCFAFLEAYLTRELTRAAEAGELFLPTAEQARRICADEAVPAAAFYERLNAVAVECGKPPIPPKVINHFLIEAGFAEGRVESVFVERRVLRANENSAKVGIYDKPVLSARTGAMSYTLMLPPETQAWLLELLPTILAPAEPETKEGEQ